MIISLSCMVHYYSLNFLSLLQFDEGKAVLDKEITTENIQVFITGEQLPLVVEFNDEVCNDFIIVHC